MRLRPNRRPDNVKAAAAAGRAAARADRKAGGFARACDLTAEPVELTPEQEAAWNRAYRRRAPRRWYR
jgi:hypothetical protein